VGWIHTGYDLPLPMANFVIPSVLLRGWLHDKGASLRDDPAKAAAWFERLLMIAEAGKYAGGIVFRVFQPFDRAEWILSVLHPSLPMTDRGTVIEERVLAMTEHEMQQWRMAMISMDDPASEMPPGLCPAQHAAETAQG
jgi:hypothetical protein